MMRPIIYNTTYYNSNELMPYNVQHNLILWCNTWQIIMILMLRLDRTQIIMMFILWCNLRQHKLLWCNTTQLIMMLILLCDSIQLKYAVYIMMQYNMMLIQCKWLWFWYFHFLFPARAHGFSTYRMWPRSAIQSKGSFQQKSMKMKIFIS